MRLFFFLHDDTIENNESLAALQETRCYCVYQVPNFLLTKVEKRSAK